MVVFCCNKRPLGVHKPERLKTLKPTYTEGAPEAERCARALDLLVHLTEHKKQEPGLNREVLRRWLSRNAIRCGREWPTWPNPTPGAKAPWLLPETSVGTLCAQFGDGTPYPGPWLHVPLWEIHKHGRLKPRPNTGLRRMEELNRDG